MYIHMQEQSPLLLCVILAVHCGSAKVNAIGGLHSHTVNVFVRMYVLFLVCTVSCSVQYLLHNRVHMTV